MKCYHLRREAKNAVIDYLYIPERDTFKGYIQEPACKLIVDYSMPRYLERVKKAVVEGKEDEVPLEIVKELDIDKKTAWKIEKARCGFNKYLETAGTTENLVKILSERAPKTLAELVKSLF